MRPPNKGYIFKRECSVAYLLGLIFDAYQPEVGLKFPLEIINLPCISYPIVGWVWSAFPFVEVDTWFGPPAHMLAIVAMHTMSWAFEASTLVL